MKATSTPTGRRQQVLDALLRIIESRGLEHGSIREVAAEAGVSIGTVQHHFGTKDDLLIAAYGEMVADVLARFRSIDLDAAPREVVRRVLVELLPLDETRRREARLHLAFTARAATAPRIAELHRETMTELHDALTRAVARATGRAARTKAVTDIAESLLAVTDGLASHAVTAPGWPPAERLEPCLDVVLDALLPRTT